MEIKHYPSGNTAIYDFKASGDPKAAILLVHGHGEHAGRYESWAARFNDRGVALRAFDLPGHGHSEGKRGVMASPEKVFDTIDKMSREIVSEYPGVPLFLYGNSLGGCIILNYLIRRRPKVHGAIVTSAWILLTETPPRFKVLIADIAKRLMPGLTLETELNAGYLSRDPEVPALYRKDPLVHDKISTGLYGWITETAAENLNRASEITVPLLVAHGRNDMIISPSGSIQVAGAAPRATLKLWEGGYHELHNDLIKDEHFDFIIEWIDTLI